MFHYFGYGSNMSLCGLRAKGVEPVASAPGRLDGWRLDFSVRHFFRHEGGMGNITRGQPDDFVLGVVHVLEDSALGLLDAAEAYGYGYDRMTLEVAVPGGCVQALAYVGMPAFINPAGLPTRRYLNILLRGAAEAGLDPDYIAALAGHPLYVPPCYAPFAVPPGNWPVFDLPALARSTSCTALAGAVFDMSAARPQHAYLQHYFAARDTTEFHLRRHDSSRGEETIGDFLAGRLNVEQLAYLNAYLHEYNAEYRYVGRVIYD